ncbi:uncharacterized protein KGF55_002708 [Candida pseudojiufengensis]|uniref:uncharacterized protein n=1 Tax=Candida pseudojiufengensis TaxID=497109 RepID=UPI0022246638|nr:uncharacterized protein KGF55_002708 [Candida pseudojiufengensis]KAI5963828.1 hypothetical protein KGF55_002708 [Candida pseudojiufengensis]
MSNAQVETEEEALLRSAQPYIDIISKHDLYLAETHWTSNKLDLRSYTSIIHEIFLIHSITFKGARDSYKVRCKNRTCPFSLNFEVNSGMTLNLKHNHDLKTKSPTDIYILKVALRVINYNLDESVLHSICKEKMREEYEDSRKLIDKVMNESIIYKSNLAKMMTRNDSIEDICEKLNDTYYKFYEKNEISKELYILPIRNTCTIRKTSYHTLLLFQKLQEPTVCGFIILHKMEELMDVLSSKELLDRTYTIELDADLAEVFEGSNVQFKINDVFIKAILMKNNILIDELKNVEEMNLPLRFQYLHHIIENYEIDAVRTSHVFIALKHFIYNQRDNLVTNVKILVQLYNEVFVNDAEDLAEEHFLDLLSRLKSVSSSLERFEQIEETEVEREFANILKTLLRSQQEWRHKITPEILESLKKILSPLLKSDEDEMADAI